MIAHRANGWRRAFPHVGGTGSELPRGTRLAAILLRSLFMTIILVVTVHVSMPQSERIWSAYEAPGDLVRMLLGFAVAAWIVIHLFMLPADDDGYRTWLHLGLFAVPFALICAIGIW